MPFLNLLVSQSGIAKIMISKQSRSFWEANKANTNYRRKWLNVHVLDSTQKILKMWMSCPRYRELLFSWPGVATLVTWRQKSMDVLDFVKNLGTLKTNSQIDLCSIHPRCSNKTHLYSLRTKTMTCLYCAGTERKDWMLMSPPWSWFSWVKHVFLVLVF